MSEVISPAQQFDQLLSDDWEARLRADPLFATYTGDHRYDDRLPDASEAGYARRLEEVRTFRQRLADLPLNALDSDRRLNYAILSRMLEDEQNELLFHAYRFPVSKTWSFFSNIFEQMPLLMPFEKETDYENYLARLAAFPAYSRQHLEVMREGLASGYRPPRVILEGVEEQVGKLITEDALENPLYQPFRRFPQTVASTQQERLRRTAQRLIQQSINPAMAELGRFLGEEYIPGARQSIAARDLPQGEAFYQHRIRFYTSLELTPHDVHQIGLDEVQRIRAEMQSVIQTVGFQGNLQAFIQFLRQEQRFYVDTPAALLKETAYVLKRMDGELPRLFGRLPRTPYGIREVPAASAPSSTTAYYFPASGDGRTAGFYYVNTYDLKSRPLYEIEALSLHEAVPGHHLQIALQQELDLPNFRRFGGFTAFVEGWALYAERLGLEVGFYADPYSNFGRLSYEMWRACRLVVDTGMHALGWTRQQAIDYMAQNTSSTLLNIANEIDRYIAWPGQALAYKIGELKIRALREKAEKALGEHFDLRTFHDRLLEDGALPLDLLENKISQWIKNQQDYHPTMK